MGNIFSGFDAEVLAESFGISTDLAERLQAESTAQGNLINVATKLVLGE